MGALTLVQSVNIKYANKIKSQKIIITKKKLFQIFILK
jgi:hypothetical protein